MAKIDSKELKDALVKVKEDYFELKWVPQSFDICVAALQAANEDGNMDDFFRYIDPEFRTNALLKAIGYETYEFEDDAFKYRGSADYYSDSNEQGTIYIYGKCPAENLVAAHKVIQRCLSEGESMEKAWTSNPMKAESYVSKIYPNKKYFKMELFFDHETGLRSIRERIFEEFWDFPERSFPYELQLFYYTRYENSSENFCEYCIEKPDEDYENLVENKDWRFHISAYDVMPDVHSEYVSLIKKRLALWLLEDSGDTKAIIKAKKDLEKAEKNASKYEKEHRDSDWWEE